MPASSPRFAAHPPLYFPNVTFWSKAACVETLVLVDDLHFSTHGEGNRMRIKTNEGAIWLTVPVLTKGRAGQRFHEVRIDNVLGWRTKHWKTLRCHYGRAPYFEMYCDRVERLFAQEWKYLVDLNLATFELVQRALRLNCQVQRSAEWGISAQGSERVIELSKHLKLVNYLTESANQKFLAAEKFIPAGVVVEYVAFTPRPYHQQYEGFVPGLSVLDLLFNEGEEAGHYIKQRGAISGAAIYPKEN